MRAQIDSLQAQLADATEERDRQIAELNNHNQELDDALSEAYRDMFALQEIPEVLTSRLNVEIRDHEQTKRDFEELLRDKEDHIARLQYANEDLGLQLKQVIATNSDATQEHTLKEKGLRYQIKALEQQLYYDQQLLSSITLAITLLAAWLTAIYLY